MIISVSSSYQNCMVTYNMHPCALVRDIFCKPRKKGILFTRIDYSNYNKTLKCVFQCES